MAMTESERDRKLLELARSLRELGVDPLELLEDQVEAERWTAVSLESGDPAGLIATLRSNTPIRVPDVFESPTFRRQLRVIRTAAAPFASSPPRAVPAAAQEACDVLRTFGEVLSFSEPFPRHRPSEAAFGWEEVGEPNRGKRVWKRSAELSSLFDSYFEKLREADKITRDLTNAAEIEAKLESIRLSGGRYRPFLRASELLAKTLSTYRAARRSRPARGEGLTLKEVALLLAYERDLVPANKRWAKTRIDALQKRKRPKIVVVDTGEDPPQD